MQGNEVEAGNTPTVRSWEVYFDNILGKICPEYTLEHTRAIMKKGTGNSIDYSGYRSFKHGNS